MGLIADDGDKCGKQRRLMLHRSLILLENSEEGEIKRNITTSGFLQSEWEPLELDYEIETPGECVCGGGDSWRGKVVITPFHPAQVGGEVSLCY